MRATKAEHKVRPDKEKGRYQAKLKIDFLHQLAQAAVSV